MIDGLNTPRTVVIHQMSGEVITCYHHIFLDGFNRHIAVAINALLLIHPHELDLLNIFHFISGQLTFRGKIICIVPFSQVQFKTNSSCCEAVPGDLLISKV